MVGNGMEGFRYSVQNGRAEKPMGLRGGFVASAGFEVQNEVPANRVALPPGGFMYVFKLLLFSI